MIKKVGFIKPEIMAERYKQEIKSKLCSSWLDEHMRLHLRQKLKFAGNHLMTLKGLLTTVELEIVNRKNKALGKEGH